MLALTDVYCLYNRARVTDLISPDELLDAARLFGSLGLGVRMRSFPSGLNVVQLDAMSDDEIVRRVTALLDAAPPRPYPYVSAPQLATLWRVPLQIVHQQLLVRRRSSNRFNSSRARYAASLV